MRRAGLNSWLKPKSCRIPRHFEIHKNIWEIPAGTWVISIMTFRFWLTEKLIVQTNVKLHGGCEFKGHFNTWPILIEEKGKHHHFVKMAKLPLTSKRNWRPYRYIMESFMWMTLLYHSGSGTAPGDGARDAPKAHPTRGAWCGHRYSLRKKENTIILLKRQNCHWLLNETGDLTGT